jgi:hypothetical protein
VVAETRAEDRRMRFIYQPALQELAISEALLGDLSGAATRLDALIAEVAPLDNPLLSGSVARDRARVALLMRDAGEFQRQHATMSAHFRATRNPCLIQQCDKLASQATGLLGVELVKLLAQAEPDNDANASAAATLVEGSGSPQMTTIIEEVS